MTALSYLLPLLILAVAASCPGRVLASGCVGRSSRNLLAQHNKQTPVTPSDNCPEGWIAAMGTLYSSWPTPGNDECIIYDGCRWAGEFSSIDANGKHGKCAKGAARLSGGNGTKVECRFTPATVKKMRMASTSVKDYKKLKGKTLEVMIEGRPNVTTTVKIG